MERAEKRGAFPYVLALLVLGVIVAVGYGVWRKQRNEQDLKMYFRDKKAETEDLLRK